MLQSKKLPYSCVHVHPGSHAGYYPGAKQVHLKLLFHPKDGTIYGAQAVGEDGIEKRIDVIATAMQSHMTVEDLSELELCYAPPVGSAKDVVNVLLVWQQKTSSRALLRKSRGHNSKRWPKIRNLWCWMLGTQKRLDLLLRGLRTP
jgi:hypothetical protein